MFDAKRAAHPHRKGERRGVDTCYGVPVWMLFTVSLFGYLLRCPCLVVRGCHAASYSFHRPTYRNRVHFFFAHACLAFSCLCTRALVCFLIRTSRSDGTTVHATPPARSRSRLLEIPADAHSNFNVRHCGVAAKSQCTRHLPYVCVYEVLKNPLSQGPFQSFFEFRCLPKVTIP